VLHFCGILASLLIFITGWLFNFNSHRMLGLPALLLWALVFLSAIRHNISLSLVAHRFSQFTNYLHDYPVVLWIINYKCIFFIIFNT